MSCSLLFEARRYALKSRLRKRERTKTASKDKRIFRDKRRESSTENKKNVRFETRKHKTYAAQINSEDDNSESEVKTFSTEHDELEYFNDEEVYIVMIMKNDIKYSNQKQNDNSHKNVNRS